MLEAIISSSARIRILTILLLNKNTRFYLRQLQAATGLAPRTVQVELSRLEKAGLLVKELNGNRTYYHINEACPIVPDLRAIFLKTVGIADILRQSLEPSLDAIYVAFVYGSFSRGTQTPQSDIDLMIIGEISFLEAVSLLRSGQEILGREINPSVYSKEEFCDRIRCNDHFICNVFNGPKIFVIGSEDELRKLAE